MSARMPRLTVMPKANGLTELNDVATRIRVTLGEDACVDVVIDQEG